MFITSHVSVVHEYSHVTITITDVLKLKKESLQAKGFLIWTDIFFYVFLKKCIVNHILKMLSVVVLSHTCYKAFILPLKRNKVPIIKDN